MYSKRHCMSFTFATVLILKKGSYLNILVSAKAVNKDEKWDRSLENSSITPITDLNKENTVEWVESNNMLTEPTALTNESITSKAGRPAAEKWVYLKFKNFHDTELIICNFSEKLVMINIFCLPSNLCKKFALLLIPYSFGWGRL